MKEPLKRARGALATTAEALGLTTGASQELIDTLCLPIAAAIAARVERSKPSSVVGIAGAQGTGKSTVTALVHTLLTHGFDFRAATVSLDDYYLPLAARQELSRSEHPLLITRGVPGTHDVSALQTALQRMRVASAGESIALLQFSKAADDRLPETRTVVGPFDVVLFEGWCVGARGEPDSDLLEPINALERDEDLDGRFRRFVNAQLQHAYASLWAELEALIFLAAPDIATVRAFRREQERKLQLSAAPDARGVMTDVQLDRFLQHFERVTRQMLRDSPNHADMVVELDARRHVKSRSDGARTAAFAKT